MYTTTSDSCCQLVHAADGIALAGAVGYDERATGLQVFQAGRTPGGEGGAGRDRSDRGGAAVSSRRSSDHRDSPGGNRGR